MNYKSDVSVIVPTYNRPHMCERAMNSALDQTYGCKIVVSDDGDRNAPRWGNLYLDAQRKDSWYLSVYDAVYKCGTKYVVVLCDDDYLEPTFVERCMSYMSDDVAFVFSESNVVHRDGTRVPHWAGFFGPSGVYDSIDMGNRLMQTHRIISPAFTLYRREDVLRCLCPGGVPGFRNATPHCPNASGPDYLLPLLILLYYPKVAWVDEPLVNLDAGPQSTTMKELASDDKGAALKANYDNAKALYWCLRQLRQRMGAV